jgi:hypothetical protein
MNKMHEREVESTHGPRLCRIQLTIKEDPGKQGLRPPTTEIRITFTRNGVSIPMQSQVKPDTPEEPIVLDLLGKLKVEVKIRFEGSNVLWEPLDEFFNEFEYQLMATPA